MIVFFCLCLYLIVKNYKLNVCTYFIVCINCKYVANKFIVNFLPELFILSIIVNNKQPLSKKVLKGIVYIFQGFNE